MMHEDLHHLHLSHTRQDPRSHGSENKDCETDNYRGGGFKDFFSHCAMDEVIISQKFLSNSSMHKNFLEEQN